MRTIAVGDIHGCSNLLDQLLSIVQPKADDRLIFLGDYVDRGPDSRGVLDRLIKWHAQGNVVCVRGNHELMMMRARRSRSDYRMWYSVGGMQALASYGSSPGQMGTIEQVPDEHWNFLEKFCLDYWETDSHIFVHAGVAYDLPMNEQDESWLFWEFFNPDFPPNHSSGKAVICGHTSQKSGEILDCRSAICIDTYAYGGGWLTALDVNSGDYWQTNIMGALRQGKINPPSGSPL